MVYFFKFQTLVEISFYVEHIALICYFVFSFLLLMYIVYVRLNSFELANISKRLVWYTLVFSINWTFIVLDDLGSIVFKNGNIITWILDCICEFSIVSIGFQNAIVWASSDLLTKSPLLANRSRTNYNGK